jgi:Protein of unknown function (DUF2809)
MLRFHSGYFIATIIFLLIELFIALYVRDGFVRPYGGDYLVVILMYCFIRAFSRISVVKAALIVLGLAYAVELSQYFGLVERLGWSANVWARTILGYGFSFWDMLAYTLGVATVLVVEGGRR